MASKHHARLKYGELVLLGHNGQLPRGNRGRKRSKFVLQQRPEANGVKRLRADDVDVEAAKAVDLSTRQSCCTHRVTYTTTPDKVAAVTEYVRDDDTDMFQIGRSASRAIDFVLFDTPDSASSMSTVSRFACRIVVDRNKPNVARIFAAGFNDSNSITLGDSSLKWRNNDGSMDGLTTNGVFIVHPTGAFCGGESDYGYWREVSVAGDLYSLRQDKRVKEKGQLVVSENNVLKDGTLINLCGATLLWRSAEGLARSPDKEDVEKLVLIINEDWNKLTMAEDLNLYSSFEIRSVFIPRKKLSVESNELLPYVHTECGHVQRYNESDIDQLKPVTCPACDVKSIVIPLCMGLEPSFYVDYGPPVYAFNPCGHMATERTVKFWSKVGIPENMSSFISQCPFCAVSLNGYPGYVELKFSFLLNGTL